MDGWNRNKTEGVTRVLDELYDVAYETKNCIRGCYTGCRTYKELSERLKRLGERLIEEAEMLSYEKEDQDDDE